MTEDPRADDPVVADIDGAPLRWSQVAERLAFLSGQDRAEVKAVAMAASDVLVVREMKVVGAPALATETAAQAADRLLALTWDGQRGCALTEAEIRLAYMQDLGRYKHPPSWTVWDALAQCCTEPDGCPIALTEQCRAEAKALLSEMSAQLQRDFAGMPALGLAAELTSVRVEESPLRHDRLPRFEQLVADLQSRDRRIKLLRYTFWQQGLPGFEKARFRRADPEVEKAVTGHRIGDLIGPIDGEDAPHLLLVAAREPLAVGLSHAATATEQGTVALQIRSKVCLEQAQRERTEYRERLLGGAQVVWRLSALKGRLSDASIAVLQAEAVQPVEH